MVAGAKEVGVWAHTGCPTPDRGVRMRSRGHLPTVAALTGAEQHQQWVAALPTGKTDDRGQPAGNAFQVHR